MKKIFGILILSLLINTGFAGDFIGRKKNGNKRHKKNVKISWIRNVQSACQENSLFSYKFFEENPKKILKHIQKCLPFSGKSTPKRKRGLYRLK